MFKVHQTSPSALADVVRLCSSGQEPAWHPAEAEEWIAADARNAEVLFPYLNGEDLNQRPDGSGSRWVIDFGNRSEREAAEYVLPFQRLETQVRTERARKPKAVRDVPWWLFLRSRPAMREATSNLSEVLVIARVSKTVMPLRVPTGQVPSEACVVFASDSYATQAVLSSSLHQLWAITYGSGMRNDPRYTPSDVFETFPRPVSASVLVDIGKRLEVERRAVMLRRDIGLTKLYNRINDPNIVDTSDPDVARLRALHRQLDEQVLDAYGWSDIDAEHGFFEFRKMLRWTVSPVARVEILDRLLEENKRRIATQFPGLALVVGREENADSGS